MGTSNSTTKRYQKDIKMSRLKIRSIMSADFSQSDYKTINMSQRFPFIQSYVKAGISQIEIKRCCSKNLIDKAFKLFQMTESTETSKNNPKTQKNLRTTC